jgi:hypothetical protein
MGRARGRRTVGITIAVGLVAIAFAVSAFVSCGNGDDRSSPTTFTAPRDRAAATTAPRLTLPPTTKGTLPGENLPPRPWRVGFANGVMPLELDDAQLAADLDGMAATGARWLRVDFYWPTIQEGGPDSWNWGNTDRVVLAAISRGLEILAMPAYSPSWARPPGTIDHHPPLDPDAYARFVHEAVKRYAPVGVHTWEIWNEPNTSAFWPPKPDPEAYTDLLRRAYVAIKAVDPKSTVITAGLAAGLDRSDGATLSARTFISRVYGAGGKGYFDAVGLHPQSFPAMPLDPHDWNSFYNTPTVYQVMTDNGDGAKKIWGTEFATPTGARFMSPDTQRDIITAGYQAWLAWPFTGPLLVYSWRDSGVDPSDQEANFGLLYHDRTPKPALSAFEGIVRQLEAREKGAKQ